MLKQPPPLTREWAAYYMQLAMRYEEYRDIRYEYGTETMIYAYSVCHDDLVRLDVWLNLYKSVRQSIYQLCIEAGLDADKTNAVMANQLSLYLPRIDIKARELTS